MPPPVYTPVVSRLAERYGFPLPNVAARDAAGSVTREGICVKHIAEALQAHNRVYCESHTHIATLPGGKRCRSWDPETCGLVCKGMCPREGVELRPYQAEALEALCEPGAPHCILSGNAKMPCAAGKTLWSLWHLMRLRTYALVVTDSHMASAHWAEQCALFFKPPKGGVLVLGEHKLLLPTLVKERPGIVICTYYALAMDDSVEMQLLRALPYGAVVLDEAQTAVAHEFQRVLEVPTCTTLTVSATYYREDNRMSMLFDRVGPLLVNIDRGALVGAGFLPLVRRVEVHVPAGAKRQRRAGGPCELVLHSAKMATLLALVEAHVRLGDKIIVFCDELAPLDRIAALVRRAIAHWDLRELPCFGPLTMHTSGAERLRMLDAFRTATGAALILVSRVADTAIDLPGANVLVQASCFTASRNQEVQRTGRIQRRGAMARTHVAYTLVTLGSTEESNAMKRRACMEDEGYSTEIVCPFGPSDAPPSWAPRAVELREYARRAMLADKGVGVGGGALTTGNTP